MSRLGWLDEFSGVINMSIYVAVKRYVGASITKSCDGGK